MAKRAGGGGLNKLHAAYVIEIYGKSLAMGASAPHYIKSALIINGSFGC
jgi:hypothetical protein